MDEAQRCWLEHCDEDCEPHVDADEKKKCKLPRGWMLITAAVVLTTVGRKIAGARDGCAAMMSAVTA